MTDEIYVLLDQRNTRRGFTRGEGWCKGLRISGSGASLRHQAMERL